MGYFRGSTAIRAGGDSITSVLAYKRHTLEVVYHTPVSQKRLRDERGDEIEDRRPDGRPRALAVAFMLAYTNGLEECYEPGRAAADFRPYHAAKLIPKGTDIAIQMHFTPNGSAVTNHVQIGSYGSEGASPQRRYLALSASAPQDSLETFAIPANVADWEMSLPVDLEFQVGMWNWSG